MPPSPSSHRQKERETNLQWLRRGCGAASTEWPSRFLGVRGGRLSRFERSTVSWQRRNVTMISCSMQTSIVRRMLLGIRWCQRCRRDGETEFGRRQLRRVRLPSSKAPRRCRAVEPGPRGDGPTKRRSESDQAERARVRHAWSCIMGKAIRSRGNLWRARVSGMHGMIDRPSRSTDAFMHDMCRTSLRPAASCSPRPALRPTRG